MKSIVLCERTLAHESEDFSTLKERKVNDEGNEKEEEKITNGIPDNKQSEILTNNFGEDGISIQQDDNKSSEILFNCKNDGKKLKLPNKLENKTSENGQGVTDRSSAASAKNNLCIDGGKQDCLVFKENLSVGGKIAEENTCECVQDINLNRERGFSVKNIEPRDEALENDKSNLKIITDEGLVENSFKHLKSDLMEKNFTSNTVEGKEEIEQSVEDAVLDMDENKENEKEVRKKGLHEFPGNNSLSKQSCGCEIQVEDVQSIIGSEKDSMWEENDLKSYEQNLKETSGEKLTDGCQGVNSSNGDTIRVEEKNQKSDGNENFICEMEENPEEDMLIDDVEQESERGNDHEDLDKLSFSEIIMDENKTSTSHSKNQSYEEKKENVVCRKRQISGDDEKDPSVKKKRFLRNGEELVQMQSEDKNMDDSSRYECLTSPDTVNASSEGLTEPGTFSIKGSSTDSKTGKKLKISNGNEESKIEGTFAVLERFRGTLKSLTRSDLEELIVQKLCEVITERSNVGELRRKAQALEQDQERWKTKVQSLTKQMREMEMVMKKYMTEVQKQMKEGDTHMVTPLKVTRSVGLQVSFYSSVSKEPKPSLTQPPTVSSPVQNLNSRNAKGTPPKLRSQFGPTNHNIRNKGTPIQKGSPAQKNLIGQQRKSIVSKPDYVSPQSNRAIHQSMLNSTRGVHNQISRTSYKSVANTTTATATVTATTTAATTTATATAMTTAATTITTTTATTMTMSTAVTTTTTSTLISQQNQNGSKVIDLTDDDDRQTGNLVKTSGPIRVVNHLSQPSASQGNRFAYLVPTTSTSTATAGGQSRQVLIATPTMPQPSRQIMCSMPPLLFKGGNVVQSGPQPHVINQSNKLLLPKSLRHPAPLPQQPVNQNTRPNLKLLPPRPALKISKVQTGIVLSWNMSLSPEHAPIASYQLYAYQESNSPPATSLWKKVGDVKALPLPMACTLTQFMSGHKYHFAVRAVDLHSRIGPFSFPGTIVLVK